MFVTEIRPLNKKKSRILFDDGEDLVLYNGEIRASRIKEQEELPDEVYEKLAGEVLTKRAKHRAMYLLLGQMRTKKSWKISYEKTAIPREPLKRLSRTWRAFTISTTAHTWSSILRAAVRKKGEKGSPLCAGTERRGPGTGGIRPGRAGGCPR